MALQRAIFGVTQQASLAGLPLLHPLLRTMASGATKEAVERTLVVDTLAQTKKFETLGLSREQAENLAVYLSEQVVLDRMRLSEKFTTKVELEKSMLEQDARIGGFKAELVQKQDMHLATLQKDLDRQQNYLDKIRSEVRHEIDKLSASQRLDLNLEKGRMRDDLQQMRDKTIELEIKLDRVSDCCAVWCGAFGQTRQSVGQYQVPFHQHAHLLRVGQGPL
eukprot:GHRQ01015332.1.p1 GENE.GHRQ01015332.1~~GHRQ01015332.1.p1  ORF type:complete len:221 (+),score=60.49 GHRQ01015332.1:362-1024(+)